MAINAKNKFFKTNDVGMRHGLGRYRAIVTSTTATGTTDITAAGDYSVEFNMGKDKKTDCIMLHVRGNREPEDLFEIIKEKFQCRIFDCSSGEFIESGTESAFGKWKEYRDKVIGK